MRYSNQTSPTSSKKKSKVLEQELLQSESAHEMIDTTMTENDICEERSVNMIRSLSDDDNDMMAQSKRASYFYGKPRRWTQYWF